MIVSFLVHLGSEVSFTSLHCSILEHSFDTSVKKIICTMVLIVNSEWILATAAFFVGAILLDIYGSQKICTLLLFISFLKLFRSC